MKKLFAGAYAPSTLGLFLRAFTFGMSASSTPSPPLVNAAAVAPIAASLDDYAMVDIDEIIKEVHGYRKQCSGNGYPFSGG